MSSRVGNGEVSQSKHPKEQTPFLADHGLSRDLDNYYEVHKLKRAQCNREIKLTEVFEIC